jgi:glucose 1-dehydrogenase
LARDGFKVVICARGEAALNETARAVREAGGEVLALPADLSKAEDVERVMATTVERFGGLDVLVTNTGGPPSGPFMTLGEDVWRSAIDSLLLSVVRLCRAAIPHMRARGGGRIINITSVHEDWPMPGNTAYCLAKGGMRMLTRTAGVELAPHGILVVGVGPGAVATPINLSTMKDPALLAKLNGAIPLGRMAKPEEIANVVVFLAGDGASYLTATTIFADGGIMQSSVGL